MKGPWKFSPWLTRLILLWPTLVFGLIATRYLVHPIKNAADVGISVVSPLGLTILRVGFGAFPLACFLFTLFCLVSARRILTGFIFVSTVISAALLVRVAGMLADGTTAESMRLVVAEIVMLVLLVFGATLQAGSQRRPEESGAA